jgi:hypothetical protein
MKVGLGPREYLMITFILLAVFAMIGIAFFLVAYSANQRKRAGQSGVDSIHYQRSQYPRVGPRATPPTT